MESMISFQSKGSNYRGEIYAPIQARPGHHEFKIMRVVQTNWNQFECFKTFSTGWFEKIMLTWPVVIRLASLLWHDSKIGKTFSLFFFSILLCMDSKIIWKLFSKGQPTLRTWKDLEFNIIWDNRRNSYSII